MNLAFTAATKVDLVTHTAATHTAFQQGKRSDVHSLLRLVGVVPTARGDSTAQHGAIH